MTTNVRIHENALVFFYKEILRGVIPFALAAVESPREGRDACMESAKDVEILTYDTQPDTNDGQFD